VNLQDSALQVWWCVNRWSFFPSIFAEQSLYSSIKLSTTWSLFQLWIFFFFKWPKHCMHIWPAMNFLTYPTSLLLSSNMLSHVLSHYWAFCFFLLWLPSPSSSNATLPSREAFFDLPQSCYWSLFQVSQAQCSVSPVAYITGYLVMTMSLLIWPFPLYEVAGSYTFIFMSSD
jgi:hypothetical protein